LQAGIIRVVYIEKYKDPAGLNFLEKAGLEIVQIENTDEI
jgi:dCMP deaminase